MIASVVSRKHWLVLAAVACTGAGLGMAACGSDDSTEVPGGNDASADGGNNVQVLGTCKAAAEACGSSVECCTRSCVNGACSATACVSDLQACTVDAECCGGVCASADGGPKLCRPLNASCRTSGNSCAAGGDCCSTVCTGGACQGQPSFCTQNGDACATNEECCGGVCTKASGASLGTCSLPSVPGATGCTVAGQVCGAAGDGGVSTCGGSCCSRSCAPFRTGGVPVCQPPSGCRPTGETCRADTDCCGGPGMPGGNGSVRCSKANATDLVGRCDNGGSCRANGAICKPATGSCNAENNCCAGNVNQKPEACQLDLLGIPRCTGVGNCADAGSQAGKACASSADCCGLACVPGGDAGGLVCSSMCAPSGGGCTTSADCCVGMACNVPPGARSGSCTPIGTTGGGTSSSSSSGSTGPVCALAGQTCATISDCCSGLLCNGGRCVAYVDPGIK